MIFSTPMDIQTFGLMYDAYIKTNEFNINPDQPVANKKELQRYFKNCPSSKTEIKIYYNRLTNLLNGRYIIGSPLFNEVYKDMIKTMFISTITVNDTSKILPICMLDRCKISSMFVVDTYNKKR